MMSFSDAAFIGLQKILPKRLISHLVYQLARVRSVWLKNLLISQFMRYFKISLNEYLVQSITEFESFNAFFTRAINPATRPIDTQPDHLISPVDGRISAQGHLSPAALWQSEIPAKQHFYNLSELLACEQRASLYRNGHFTTVYLAPFNYHRVHAPVTGQLSHLRYCPGTLYSVNATTAHYVPNLFVRNERVVAEFATAHGPVALVLVGALNVGCMSMTGLGEIRPAQAGSVPGFIPRAVTRGEVLGAFNMGSTVIMILPKQLVTATYKTVNDSVQLGEALLKLQFPTGHG